MVTKSIIPIAALSLAIAACTNGSDSAQTTTNAAGTQSSFNQTPTPLAPASARLTEGPESLTLITENNSVSIQLKPLALSVLNAQKEPVLTSASPSQTQPIPRIPLPTRAPGGPQGVPQAPATYAPFAYTVGGNVSLQYPASFWVGDMALQATAGIEYQLTEVVSHTFENNTLTLLVATNDPSGTTATVTLAPAENASLSITLKPNTEQPVTATAASFASHPSEDFYGFGGRRNALSQRGEVFLNWTEEFHQTVEAGEGLYSDFSGINYQFPTGPQGAYYVHSLFVSDQGYGFMLDQTQASQWRMASDRDDAWRVETLSNSLTYLVVTGTAKEAVSQLSGINGRHRVPPAWALGPMVSETIQEFSDDPVNYTAKVQDSLNQIEQLKLPFTAFAFEGWVGTKETGSYEDIIARIQSLGLKPMTYFRGFTGQQDDELEEHTVFEEAIDGAYVATNAIGQPYLIGSPLMGRGLAAVIDFTNPATVDWWKGRIKQGLAEGSEGFMQDFGEQTLSDMLFADGSTGATMHNAYPNLFHRATREAFDEFVAENPRREPWFFVRNGYSGRHGSAHYESASWSGDSTTDWSRASGIGSIITDMLNRGVGGAYGYVSEIGGYIDAQGPASAELVLRWANMASLMPVHRLHGGPINGTPMPWRFGSNEVVEAYRKTMQRHIAAQPLIMRLWQEALQTGIPITRPMWLQYPDDEQAALQDQQFMLGDNVLVAPVVKPGALGRDVYFPAGCWKHPETGEIFEGPVTQAVAAAVDELPYFFACGTAPFTLP